MMRRRRERDVDRDKIALTQQRFQIRILAYCIMPNHWHLVVWPRSTDELSRFMKWLTQVHAAR